MNSKSYDLIRLKSKGHFLASDFSKLKQLAKTTIGHSNQFLLSELKVVLDIYFQMDSKIKEIEKQILDLVNSLKPAILTIPGIGYLSAATILSEFGDFSRFKIPSKMLAFAGSFNLAHTKTPVKWLNMVLPTYVTL